jgi:amino acid adenylation domain-containing protein
MSDAVGPKGDSSSLQRPTQSRRVCPTNAFVPFESTEIEQSIPARFERQVRKYPDRLAVKAKSASLTYQDLNRAANRVARAVLAQRPGEGEPTALLLEHGAPMIIGILGVLKAGKIYVPLDASYPLARTHYMLEDAQATLIVTDGKHLHTASEWAQHGRQVLNIDALDPNLSDQNLGLTISPDAFAYTLYTSGSTGQPKGVVQNHRNVLHNMMKYINGSHICADDRLSLLFSYSYSAAVTNTFGALFSGAGLFPFNLREEGLARLATWLIQEEITVYHSVSTVFRQFLDILTGAEAFPKLRLIELTGEPVSVRDVERFKQYFSPHCLLHNRMAATEMSIIRQYFLDKETPVTDGIVPVGYAVADTEVLLLDEAGQAVGVNQTGEIAIKSRYLVPGYWRQPELTRATFLPDPHGGDERIYRTGDLGYLLPDGCLVHLGRKDFQVKVRGHRIEVSEIERALLDHPAVKEALVLAREHRPGDQRLVAYVVPAPGARPTIVELRQRLQATLPDYMVPSAFVFLEALPVLPNGKVDRRALPAPEVYRPKLEATYIVPRTDIERLIGTVWQEVLRVEQVGLHDNFFDLGGHSLLLGQVHSKLCEVLGHEISMTDMLEYPTISALTNFLSRRNGDPAASRLGNESSEKLNADKKRLKIISTKAVNLRKRMGGHDG